MIVNSAEPDEDALGFPTDEELSHTLEQQRPQLREVCRLEHEKLERAKTRVALNGFENSSL